MFGARGCVYLTVSGNCTTMRLTQFLYILLFLLSCKSPRDESEKTFALKIDCRAIEGIPFVFADNIDRSVPKIGIDPNKSSIRCIEESLGLKTLRNGFDSSEIRLWRSGYDSVNNSRVIVIRNTNGQNLAELIYVRYVIKEDSVGQTLDSLIGSRRILGEPKSGWEPFFKTIEQKGIYKFPHYLDIPGYMVDSGGNGYWIEFATKEHYKQYVYPEPHRQQVQEAKRFTQLVSYIETEFGISK